MTVRTALLALLGAVALAVPYYYVAGFPANVPLAVGSAVLLAELIETARAGAGVSRAVVLRSIAHGILTGLASWLGVFVVRLFGWMG